MFTATPVRIDASLAPVKAPLPAHIQAVIDDFTSGAYDHMPTFWMDALTTAIARAQLVINARFNDHLNSLLSQYGLHVTQVPDPADQVAVRYTADYGMTDALDDALAMRDWFLPAARHTWVDPQDVTVDISREIGGEVPLPR